MAFFNTKDVGPIIIDVPPGEAIGSLNGNAVTVWQTSLEDVGLLGKEFATHSCKAFMSCDSFFHAS
jgi:hypothetical protein